MRARHPFVLVVWAFVAVSCAGASGPIGAGSRAGRRADPTEATQHPGSDCRASEDCGEGMRCYAPDFVPGSGAQMAGPPPCEGDGDCDASSYCGNSRCTPRCTSDEACGPTGVCAQGRCAAIRCDRPTGHGACPTNFSCGASLSCERDKCESDGDCEQGACVSGLCYAKPGFCASQGYCCPP